MSKSKVYTEVNSAINPGFLRKNKAIYTVTKAKGDIVFNAIKGCNRKIHHVTTPFCHTYGTDKYL